MEPGHQTTQTYPTILWLSSMFLYMAISITILNSEGCECDFVTMAFYIQKWSCYHWIQEGIVSKLFYLMPSEPQNVDIKRTAELEFYESCSSKFLFGEHRPSSPFCFSSASFPPSLNPFNLLPFPTGTKISVRYKLSFRLPAFPFPSFSFLFPSSPSLTLP